MIIYRAPVCDSPVSPFTGGALRASDDAGLAVDGGSILDRGPFPQMSQRHPDAEVVDLRAGLLLPGLIDTHVHYPQLRVIGGLGRPLLDWLQQRALPEETRLHDVRYARELAGEFVTALLAAGTTTALVFGSHFAPAVDELFQAAAVAGLRITSGLVVGDRLLAERLHTSSERAYEQGRDLARRWHGTGRARYAVTPRFSLSCTDALLASCAALHRDVPGSWITTHINENTVEVHTVRQLFGCGYLDSYDRHGLVGARSVLAHNVHPTDPELARLAAAGAAVAHCPTSNAALGSGLFPLDRHLARGVRVALGSDVGAGTGLSLFKEGLQAYFLQQLRGPDGVPLTPAHLLHLATAAGAAALGLAEQVGDLSVGKRFDALWLRPAEHTALAIGLRHADDATDALGKVFALAGSADIAAVWIDGTPVRPPPDRIPAAEDDIDNRAATNVAVTPPAQRAAGTRLGRRDGPRRAGPHTPGGTMAVLTFEQFNTAPLDERLHNTLRDCCTAEAWIEAVAAGRPYASEHALFDRSDAATADLDGIGLAQALAGYPRLGERTPAASPFSSEEQAQVTAAGAELRRELAAANAAYERRFGQVYLVCTTGRSADQLLAICRARLRNDPDQERAAVKDELVQLNRLRLAKLLGGR